MPEDMLETFMRGGCYAFALWLHDRTGVPAYGLLDDDGRIHHALIADVAAGVGYDVRGKLPLSVVHIYKGRFGAGRHLVRLGREELAEHAADPLAPIFDDRTIAACARHRPDLRALLAGPQHARKSALGVADSQPASEFPSAGVAQW